jgi:hypothetical protein
VNIQFEAYLTDIARWQLDRMRVSLPADHARVVRCIAQLERNPFPPPALLGPLVVPGRIVYAEAYRCHGWRIAFHVEDDAFVVIEELGHWPPRVVP